MSLFARLFGQQVAVPPALPSDAATERSILTGYDGFYALPPYITKFIEQFNQPGWVVKSQTILRQVSLFKAGQVDRVAYTTYEAIEDNVEGANRLLMEAINEQHA
jgi:hypothetical protein